MTAFWLCYGLYIAPGPKGTRICLIGANEEVSTVVGFQQVFLCFHLRPLASGRQGSHGGTPAHFGSNVCYRNYDYDVIVISVVGGSIRLPFNKCRLFIHHNKSDLAGRVRSICWS